MHNINTNINEKIKAYIIAPSGYSFTPELEQALQTCMALGITCNQNSIDTLKNRSYFRFSGTDSQRLADITTCFHTKNFEKCYHINSNNNAHIPSIVMSMRGGYGMHRIVKDINWQHIAKQIEQNDLKIVGHSDFTLFNAALYAKTQTISYAGPMLTSDFAFSIEKIDAFMLKHFIDAMYGRALEYNISNYTHNNINININKFKGILWGGNLAILVSIMGTPYFPKINDGLLFVEDINEPPFRVDRALHQLYVSGILTQQQALIFGDFSNYKTTDYDQGFSMHHVIDYWAEKLLKYNVSVFTQLAFGHTKTKATLPFGGRAEIHYSSPETSILKIY